jgi:NitT/TauT family transport system substrate-binding protein
MLSRRHALEAIAASLAFTPALADAQGTPATLRIGALPTDSALPFFFGVRTGLFERAGLKLEVSRMTSGAAIAAAIAGGALDIGQTSMLGPILGFARGIPFTVVAPATNWISGADGGLVVAASSPLHAAKDFEGKTIAAAAVNDINGLAMKAWMDRNGADSSALKVVEIPQLSQPAALEQGRVVGITVVNPAFTIAMAGGKARVAGDIFDAIAKRFMLVCWFSTTPWIAQNRPLAQRFIRVLSQSAAYVGTHAAETVVDVAAVSHLDNESILHERRMEYATRLHAADIQPVIDVAAKYKAIEKSYSAAELVSEAALT